MKSRYIFLTRGFYWDWWIDTEYQSTPVKFPMGYDPNRIKESTLTSRNK